MGGTDGHARRHETPAGLGISSLVTADVEAVHDFLGLDFITVAVAGHTRRRDDVCIGTFFKDRVDQHRLGIGVIEGFTDDLIVL